MKNIKLFIITALTLLFCLPTGTFARGVYSTLTASVPVDFFYVKGAGDCTVVMETTNGSPAPHKSEILFSASGTDEFNIDIDEPGTYRYKVYLKADNTKSANFDDTVYTVTVFVTINTNDTLKYAIVAASNKTMAKPDKLKFTNDIKNGGGGNGGGGGSGGGKDDSDKSHGSTSGGPSRIRKGTGDSAPLNRKDEKTTEKSSESGTETPSETPSEEPSREDSSQEENVTEEQPTTEEDHEAMTSNDMGLIGSGNNAKDGGEPPKTDAEITDETAVNTGDRNTQGLWIALMCISLAVAAASYIAEKLEKRRKFA